MEGTDLTTAPFRVNFVNGIISNSFFDNIHSLLPLDSQLSRSPSLSHVADQDPVTRLENNSLDATVIILFIFSARVLAVCSCNSISLFHSKGPLIRIALWCLSLVFGCQVKYQVYWKAGVPAKHKVMG